MKKRIVTICTIVLVLCFGAVFAANQAIEIAETAKLMDVQRIENKIEEAVENVDLETVNTVVAYLIGDKGNLSEKTYFDLCTYIDLLLEYQPTQQEQSFLEARILEGQSMSVVAEVFKFWRTTDCPMDSMNQALSLRTIVSGNHWAENAYNIITENRYGVLDLEAYTAYLGQGLDMEDIDYANTLCRKGVLTIQQILDQKLSGQTWEEITMQIEPLGKQAIRGISSRLTARTASAGKMMLCRKLSQIQGEDMSRLAALSDDEVATLEDHYQQTLFEKRNILLLELGVKNIQSEAEERQRIYLEQEIIANGVTMEQIIQMRSIGLTDLDILNTSEVHKHTGAEVEQIVEEYRTKGNWFDVEGRITQ